MGVKEASPGTLQCEVDAAVLQAIERALCAMLEDAPTPQAATAGPWAPPQREPRRIILIDGARGTGKTALLLTLLEAWRTPAAKRAWVSNEETKRILAMPPLCLSPIPPGLPLLSWLVQAFRPVVDWALHGYDGPNVRGFSQLDAQHGDVGLLVQWQRLHDDSVVAWQAPSASDPFERAEDHLRRVRKWAAFPTDWRRFFDTLCAQLARTGGWRGSAGVLVLPIDGVDLQLDRAPELLSLLRMLQQPRLVFLITGCGVALEHALQLDSAGQRARLAYPQALPHTKAAETNILPSFVDAHLRFCVKR